MTSTKLKLIFYTILVLTAVFGFLIVYTLLDFIKTDVNTKNYTFNVIRNSPVNIEVPPFAASDKVYLIFNTTSRVELEGCPTLKQIPYEIEGRPFDFENWILFQQQCCLVANEGSSNITLQTRFIDPASSYAVKVFEGEANYTLFNYVDLYGSKYIGVHVQASKGQSSRFQQVMLACPFQQIAEQNFRIEGSVKLLSGKINHVILLLITRDRNWLPYLIAPKEEIILGKTINFNIDLYNQTLFGTTLFRDFSKQITFIAITIGLDDMQWKYEEEAYANVGIGKITIQNGSEKTVIEPDFFDEYTVNCKLYIFKKFQPTQTYMVLVLGFTFLIFVGAFVLALLNGPKLKLRKFFAPLIKTETVPDYRPETYDAKLCYRARYEKLQSLLAKFVGKKISVLTDVGCGLGAFNQYLYEKGFDVEYYVGCDIDKESLKKASSIERIVCDVNYLPFKQDIAEVTICSEVLEHTINPNIGFNELLRITKKWLFVSFPDERIKNALGFRYPEHISEPNVTEFKKAAQKEKFTLIKTEKFFLPFPPSVLDKMRFRYDSFYRPILMAAFKFLSVTLRNLCLIKVILLIFKKAVNTS
ncbi:MAG: class I SAM-dependent methyltransferase [Candidatus Bathyarchaeia archaeon]